MKNKLIIIRYSILFILFVSYLIFVKTSCANVVYLSWFSHIPMIEKLYAGTFTLSDAIQRYGEHGLFGYNIFLLLNVKLFKLNALFDAYLNAFVVLGCGWLVFRSYAKHQDASIPNIFNAIMMLFIGLAMFTVSQWTSGAMETQVRLGTFFLLLLFYVLDHAIVNTRKELVKEVLVGYVCIVFAVMIFGTLYTFSGFPAIVLLLSYMAKISKKSAYYAACICLGLFLSVIGYVVFYKLNFPSIGGASTLNYSLFGRIAFVVKFLLAYLGSATMSRTFWEDSYIASANVMLINGSLVLLAYLYACILFIFQKIYSKTWMPILMISYSLGVGVMVLIGRGLSSGWGWDSGTNYWYAVHTKFGLAGCFMIFAYALVGGYANRTWGAGSRSRVLATMAFSCILILGLIGSNIIDWRRAPYVKKYFEAMIPYAYSSDPLPVDAHGNTPFQASLTETVYSLSVLKKLNLAYYAKNSSSGFEINYIVRNGEPSDLAILDFGWFAREDNHRWVSGTSQITFLSGSKGRVVIDGYCPASHAPNKIAIYNKDELLAEKRIDADGLFSVEVSVPSCTKTHLRIITDKHFIPESLGISPDKRDLGTIVSNIWTY